MLHHRSRSTFILLVIAAVFWALHGTAAAGGGDWVSFEDGSAAGDPSLAIECSDYTSIQLGLEISGMGTASLEKEGAPFASIALGGCGFTTEVGRPCLPVIRKFIVIPHGATGSLRLKDSVYREYTLSELDIVGRVVPAQAPVPKIEGAMESATFVLDETAYGTDGWCLEHEALFEVKGFIRGYRAALLEINPINYNPVAGKLRVLTRAGVEIRLEGSDPVLTRSMMERYAEPAFDRLAECVFINNQSFKQGCLGGGGKTGRSTGYLIIAHPNFVSNASLSDFIDHKKNLGFEVNLVDSVSIGGDKKSIKNFIADAFKNWPVPPAYVLLVGDTTHISHWVGMAKDHPATDLNYAQARGTGFFPDLFIGRFSVSSNTQIDRLVQKTLAMETLSLKESVFMASEDNYWISEGTHNHVIKNYLKNDGWSYDKLYCHTHNAKTYQVTNAFNDGRSLAVYSGHGSKTSWADGPPFSKSNVQALVNTVYPVVLSFACLTGAYDLSECFAETWIRDDHGAVIFWGASESSYWDADDILQKRIFKGWYNHGQERFAQMTDFGKYELYQHYGGGDTARLYYEMYNIMGDPSVKILGEDLGGSFTNFGTGIPSSTHGQPLISGEGDLFPGGLGFELSLDSVCPLAQGTLFLGLVNSGGLPFKGGFLYPFPFTLALPVAVDSSGSLDINGQVPPSFPGNVHLYLQSFFVDAMGPVGFTATDGLDIHIF